MSLMYSLSGFRIRPEGGFISWSGVNKAGVRTNKQSSTFKSWKVMDVIYLCLLIY